jgi:hypothetical protein
MNMQFFSNSSNIKSPIPLNKINSRFNFIINKPFKQPILNNPLHQNPGPTPPQNIPIGNGNKMKWGEPIWFLFHTLAEKVKDDSFGIIRKELLNTILLICSNLPCPKCTKHATEYLNKVNFENVQTKDDLKKLLFLFHNEVSQRKNMPLFKYDDLDNKYSAANTIKIIQYFMAEYSKTDFNVTMITENMQRGMVVDKLKKWFQTSISFFNL